MTIAPAASAESTTMQAPASADGGYLRNSALSGRIPIAPSVRIFTTCDVTHLLVIQHLRRHLPAGSIRDYLIWYPTENNRVIDELMTSIISSADFADSLDIRHGASLQPRTHSRMQWLLESPRRLRADATMLHRWMDRNGIAEETTELWTAEPFHFNVIFARGMLRRAIHVKIPHCFNFEDVMSPGLKDNVEAPWREAPWVKKHIYFPWLRWTSGMDVRLDKIIYDRAYTFAAPSPWSANSVDASGLISLEAFAGTYSGLPGALRAEVDNLLAPIRASAKPLVLLLLFGLGEDDAFRTRYQRAMARIFSEHATELQGASLVVKWHPGASGEQEPLLVEWLRNNIAAQVHEIRHPLNLEFMLPQLRPDYVVAGLCGSLPIVRDLRAGQPIIIAEWLDLYLAERPGERHAVTQFLRGIEIW